MPNTLGGRFRTGRDKHVGLLYMYHEYAVHTIFLDKEYIKNKANSTDVIRSEKSPSKFAKPLIVGNLIRATKVKLKHCIVSISNTPGGTVWPSTLMNLKAQ